MGTERPPQGWQPFLAQAGTTAGPRPSVISPLWTRTLTKELWYFYQQFTPDEWADSVCTEPGSLSSGGRGSFSLPNFSVFPADLALASEVITQHTSPMLALAAFWGPIGVEPYRESILYANLHLGLRILGKLACTTLKLECRQFNLCVLCGRAFSD